MGPPLVVVATVVEGSVADVGGGVVAAPVAGTVVGGLGAEVDVAQGAGGDDEDILEGLGWGGGEVHGGLMAWNRNIVKVD